ncbi:hypothetical protein [Mesorhizobium sp.]|uniref:hypothetical protein n=1 Tax=Mesorhizobium sp. TaxID=1871066 RepID=UPI000FE2A30A|nr:hypothetical protein [Mesorhizobium sp.]RWQ12374.1 MAG: hypothetical protein EOR91_01275 [Mesorhizobium sp.]
MKRLEEFMGRLVPRIPAAQASQADHCAELAAPAHVSSQAGAAFCHFTEYRPIAAMSGQDTTAPAVKASSAAGAVTLSVKLSPAVALVLRLAVDAAGIDQDETIARAICRYAERIGIPSLARPALDDAGDDIADDLGDLPEFVRRDQMRFSRARETPRGK